MNKQCHILNGDALKDIFPTSISGDQIIMRECLVDGNVTGDTLEDLFDTRATFISENFPEFTKTDYFEKTVPEISKLLSIYGDTDINLWFEEDLFCQVNFWFCVNTLVEAGREDNLYLISPKEPHQYAFGYCSTAELEQLFENKAPIHEPLLIKKLWVNYKSGNLKELKNIAGQLKSKFPFIETAVQAHIDRAPNDEENGVPYKTLRSIINELGTTDFKSVFEEFTKRLPIYGFGDTQVKKILKKIENRPRK